VATLTWPPRLPWTLGACALALGGLAAVSGNPDRVAHGTVGLDRPAQEVEHPQSEVTPLQLATWIRDRKPGLRFFDLQADTSPGAYSIPGADRVALGDLRTTAVAPEETVVLYADAGRPAAQGWSLLRARGIEHVYVLRGGLDEWSDVILNPTLSADATPQARAAFAAAAPLARYFGGLPRVAGPGEAASPAGAGAESQAPPDTSGPAASPARAARPHWRQSC
jgi:rhodanese-related sulfurtransferase